MTWVLTSTGHEVCLRHPMPGSINLSSIAHHLSLINRFCGATVRPYSVAEHSLLVCDIAEREFHLDCHGLMAALMHDAHEFVTGDLATPAKEEVPGWHAYEYRFERLVRTCFALHTASAHHRNAIKQADLIALATEREQLLPKAGGAWAVLSHVRPAGWVDLMDKGRCSLTWKDWRAAFEDRADALDFERQMRRDAQREGA